jgi:uncharacterized membrane protein HdeD (DUF308 family)
VRRTVGIVLVVIGLVALIWGGFSFTREKKVLDLGPIEATTQKRETVPLPPVLGVIALIGGIVLIALPSKSRV